MQQIELDRLARQRHMLDKLAYANACDAVANGAMDRFTALIELGYWVEDDKGEKA